uniref:EF-hand domain-containing protein n=1 Tax=Alexandrium monilatum TaxID=311494 RepID=A0A7S4QA18_9DINO
MSHSAGRRHSHSDVLYQFRRLDKSGSGRISVKTLRCVFEVLGIPELDTLTAIRGARCSSDSGDVDYNKLITWIWDAEVASSGHATGAPAAAPKSEATQITARLKELKAEREQLQESLRVHQG